MRNDRLARTVSRMSEGTEPVRAHGWVRGASAALGAFLALLMAACAAPQADRYYSLRAFADSRPAEVSRQAPPYRLRLAVVQIPIEADRAQLVIQEAKGDPAVQVLNESLWVAPLHDQLQDSLLDGVSRQLGLPETQGLPDQPEMPVRRIVVRINRFDLQWGRAAGLSASWTDTLAAQPAKLCRARLRQAVAEQSVAALVGAQRAVVHQLADLIAHGRRASEQASPGGVEVVEFGCT